MISSRTITDKNCFGAPILKTIDTSIDTQTPRHRSQSGQLTPLFDPFHPHSLFQLVGYTTVVSFDWCDPPQLLSPVTSVQLPSRPITSTRKYEWPILDVPARCQVANVHQRRNGSVKVRRILGIRRVYWEGRTINNGLVPGHIGRFQCNR